MSESRPGVGTPGTSTPAPGERVVAGRYRLLRELGRGGMGIVWLAEDEVLDRQIAVKELSPPSGLAGADLQAHQRRALREARSAARIHHPNAVTLHQIIPASDENDAVYLIMEFVEGPTLDEVIRRDGALPGETVAAYGLQLLSVLEDAHAKKLVHRDIKPGNILIAANDQVKLTDFGIAYSLGDTHVTRGGIVGTQAYLAPELFKPGADVTTAADLWSLGATLFHAAEGRSPFARDSTAAMLSAILNDALPVPRCSPALAAAITGMLQRDPARRVTVKAADAQLRRATGHQVPRERKADPVSDQEPAWNPDEETRHHADTRRPGDQGPDVALEKTSPPKRRLSRRTVIAGSLLVVAAGIVADVAVHSHGSGILTLRATITNPAGGPDAIAFSSDSTMLATYSSSSPITLWDATDGSKIASLPYGTGISAVAFNPDGQTLAVVDSNANLHVWDIASRTPTTISMSNEAVLGFAFSPDGAAIAVADVHGVVLLDAATLRPTTSMSGLPASAVQLTTVAFSPDGGTLAAGDPSTGDVYVWSVSGNSLIAHLSRPAPLGNAPWFAFSPDSGTLAVASSTGHGHAGDVWLWDVASRTWITSLTESLSYGVTAIAFSPHGRTLAVADINGDVFFWNPVTRVMYGKQPDPDGADVDYVTFSPDGKTMATSSSGPSVYLWNTAGIE